jgi:hypothetical protein
MYIRILIVIVFLQGLITSCKKEEINNGHDLKRGVKQIWALDDGEKIKNEDIDNPLASDPNNAVWKDSTINIFGGRNEIVAFQLIIQSETNGIENVNIIIDDLKNGTAIIPGSQSGPTNPYDYRERYIELFTEHYLNITKRSAPLWLFAENAAPSAYYTGWVPDCLIPFSATPGKGGAPFSIAGNRSQGIWVDILIPRDASAGIYSGKVTVTVSDKTFREIPLLLNVYNFSLPDSNHLKNMFGMSPWDLAKRHGVQTWSPAYFALEAKYLQMAHRHRFDIVSEVSNLTDMTNYYRRYLTGEMYTSVSGYAGPGENVGNSTFSIGYGGAFPEEYGGSPANMNKADWWTGSDSWYTWFQENAPSVEYHKYLFPDEPEWKGPVGALGTGSFDTIRMQADWTHTNPGPGRNISCLVTNTMRPGLMGYVDFWSVSSEEAVISATPEAIASEKALGHKYGIYNGYRPGMGAVITDADGIEFRVMPWIVWKYNIDQYFYWSVNAWNEINVFTNPLTYGDEDNGDGTFFYPGEDHLFPTEDRGLEGPLSSIRAKNWRRGEQDYEYLWLARQAGLESEIKPIVDECVPTALWDAKFQNNISWSSRGYKFEQYRKQIAQLLSANGVSKK